MLTRPLFVHACHCTWCQRESGASFALNAMIESDRVQVTGVEPEMIHTPSNSGLGQRVARCPSCKVAVWSHYAGSGPVVRFVRVGTLDDPGVCPPDIHIFTQSKQAWVNLQGGAPAVPEYYEREDFWPADSLERRAALLPAIQAYQASLASQPDRPDQPAADALAAMPSAVDEPAAADQPLTKYLISFPGPAMDVPADDMPAVAEAAHALVRQAKAAGVYVFAGGINEDVAPVMVAADGGISGQTYPQTREFSGGFCVLELPSRAAALRWATGLAQACRCAQELREFQFDPES